MPPHVPEVRLHLASEVHDLWHKTEAELAAIGLPPPFWAFAWAGGQGLARYVLDHPETVKGKRVLDFASGSGLVGIAAKMAGASTVICSDIDPFCASAIALNAELNDQSLTIEIEDMTEAGNRNNDRFDCVLAGDVFYDREMAAKVWPFLQQPARSGKLVLLGDPDRAYFPKSGLEKLAEYQIGIIGELEDVSVKKTDVWRVS